MLARASRSLSDFGFEVFKSFFRSGQPVTGDGCPDEILGRDPALHPTSGSNLGETGFLVGRENSQLRPAWEATVYDAMGSRGPTA